MKEHHHPVHLSCLPFVIKVLNLLNTNLIFLLVQFPPPPTSPQKKKIVHPRKVQVLPPATTTTYNQPSQQPTTKPRSSQALRSWWLSAHHDDSEAPSRVDCDSGTPPGPPRGVENPTFENDKFQHGFSWWFGLVVWVLLIILYIMLQTKKKRVSRNSQFSSIGWVICNTVGGCCFFSVCFLHFFLSTSISSERLHLLKGWESSRPSPPSPPYLLTLRVPHLWPRLTDPQPGDIKEGISRFFDDPTSKRWGRNDGWSCSHVGLWLNNSKEMIEILVDLVVMFGLGCSACPLFLVNWSPFSNDCFQGECNTQPTDQEKGLFGVATKKTTTKFRKSIPNIWCYLDEWWMIEIIEIIKLLCLWCCMA